MNGRRRFLVGTVLSIQNSSFIYPACQNCCSRLILTPCRYECYKCGTGYKDATHRYKLCVKVSEENRLHVITIFGKCLETIFGASADSCHFQISSHLSRDLEHDKAQELLFQAAERCLIGRSFIFAVKVSESFGKSGSLSHSDLHHNMVACQIILLNEDSMSCTILSYFNLLVASLSSKNPVHTKTDVSTDSTNRDLSDLGFSESRSSIHQSWNPYDEYWQQSLGLVSSPLSSTLREGNRTEPFPHRESLSSPNTTVRMQEQLSNTDIATPSSRKVSFNKNSFSRHTHSYTPSPPSSSHFHRFSSKSKTVLGPESCLQNVSKSGSCPSQSCSASATQHPLQTGEVHEGKEEIWEDFPFSESLSEFIAKIEDDDGVKSPFAAKKSEIIRSTEEKLLNERECRRSCYLMTIPDANQIQNCTLTKEASHVGFDKRTGNGSDSRIFVRSCKVLRRDDASSVDQAFPSVGLFDVLSRDSARVVDHQNPDCSKRLSNGTDMDDSWDLSGFIEDLDKSEMSSEKGISSRRDNVVVGDEPKRSDVEMEKMTSEVESTMAGDHYNASADLFEASNSPDDTLTQHIGQGRLLFSITDSPGTDLLPYRPRDSHISVSSVSEIYETWNNLPTEDFAPYLQSTPLLRRLSGTGRLTVDARCLRMTSNSRSSIVAIRAKSHSTIRHILLKNTGQRKSALFHGLSENGSLWSPQLSPFLNSERSTAMIAKNRKAMLSRKLWKKEAILENKENDESLRRGRNDDPLRTVKRTDCGKILGEDAIKHGGDAPDKAENRSPVNSSLQEDEDRLCSLQGQLLPSDWSPELFPGKSNGSQPHECLQRRLF